MTPLMLIIGGLLVFWASAFIMVILPAVTLPEKPSDIWRPMTALEKEGFDLYVRNGCSYCHSLYVRTNDWDKGSERIAQAGDYVGMEPTLLGTERVGPDLSQEGGEHPDDWHTAHFINPRNTGPISLMPNWEFLGMDNLRRLTAFVQYLGMQLADKRVARQKYWKEQAVKAFESGPDKNIEWLHSHIPEAWLNMPNPYPATDAALQRGKEIYQEFCIGCHGPIGDGQGRAAKYLLPQPLNFTLLRRHLVQNKYIGGIFYYQVMNGITGTAMPYFKRDLESAKIWDVSNYLAVSFLGYSDSTRSPKGIGAAYEPEWKNPYTPPQTGGPEAGTPQPPEAGTPPKGDNK
jgi:cbb3-type cytochrome c oxidase subunit II